MIQEEIIPERDEICFCFYLEQPNEYDKLSKVLGLIKRYESNGKKVAVNYRECPDRKDKTYVFYKPSYDFVGELLVKYNVTLKSCVWI